MSFKVFSRLAVGTLRLKPPPPAFSASTSGCSLTVKHDRPNRRFTVSPGSEAGKQREAAVDAPLTGEIMYGSPASTRGLLKIHTF